MLPDRISNPGPLTYESGALPIALRGPTGEVINQSATGAGGLGIIRGNKVGESELRQ